LPDISALNGTAVDNVREFDGLTVTPFTGLLDTYTGAAAGYSVRRLSGSYTGACMRVRRDSDNVEADVGFDSNNEIGLTSPISNTTSGTYTDFADFIGHGGTPANGFVRWWYDQSGNSSDIGNISSGGQPLIYDGSIVTVESGGKPGVLVQDNNDNLEALGILSTTDRNMFQWSVYSLGSGSFWSPVKGGALIAGHFSTTYQPRTIALRATSTPFANATGALTLNQAYLRHDYADTTDIKTFLDKSGTPIINISDANEDWASGDMTIGSNPTSNSGPYTVSEVVVWQTGSGIVPSNRTGIENNIGFYFGI
jgi:hypothetical protein